ncbi:MAG: PorT family protein [Ignavibacteria bacterium]|nr:PorT family protein [Ignavibacteria bacterium]MCC7158762.1 PorT family protein [Ignavibacteria bacterium]
MKLIRFTIIVFAVSMIIFLTPRVFSQSTGLGIEGGINIANVSSTPSVNLNSRTGFMVGGFADIGVSRIASIKPGIRYIVKGFTRSNNGFSLSENLHYIEFPILMKFGIPLNDVKPYFEAGPTLAIQLSASEDQTTANQSNNYDAGSLYESLDFGLYFGSGIEYNVGNKISMFTGGGYSLGLTNTSKTTVSLRNRGFQFAAGVKFGM